MRPTGWCAALAVMLVLAVPLATLALPSAHAASTVTVNSTVDEPDASPGDGQGASAPSDDCTLRAAIMEANALPGADTNTVPAGRYELSRINLADDRDAGDFDDLDILVSVTIDGAGPSSTIISPRANASDGRYWGDRLVDVVTPSANVTLAGLAIAQARGFVDGGGIRNRGALTLRNVAVTDNSLYWGNGGGPYNPGSATLIDVAVQGNSAITDWVTTGGGILNAGSLTATRLVVRSSGVSSYDHLVSSWGAGGGLYNSGQATLTDAVVDGNSANLGGRIVNTGTLTLNRVQVSRNRVNLGYDGIEGVGGGISIGGTLTATTVTVSENQAATRTGGIVVWASGTATLTNVTIVDNTATQVGRQSLRSDGGRVWVSNTVAIRSGDDNCSGPVASQGSNLDSGDGCGFHATGDGTNVDPRLGPLADNAGFSQTHALLADSLAIDRLDPASCPAVDQRGEARPRDGSGAGCWRCDIGAFEVQPAPVTCSPRPPVQVLVARHSPGALQATIAATGTANGSPNRLRALLLGRATNATIDYSGERGLGGSQIRSLPTGPEQIRIEVHRGSNGDAATVELGVADDCGIWSPLVGGGREAWGGPRNSATVPTPVTGPAGNPAPVTVPPTAAPLPSVACTPRPPVALKTKAAGPGRLQVTVTAGQGGLTQPALGGVTNAVVEAAGQTDLTGNVVAPLPEAPAHLMLIVRRIDATKPVNVPLTVTDGCGAWQTLGGGGPAAF